jgi:hypothetical protein
MITVFCVGVILAIFNRIQKINIRPVFVKVKVNDGRKNS